MSNSEFSESDNNEGYWTPFAEGSFDWPDFSQLAENDHVPVVDPKDPLNFRQEFDGTQPEVTSEDAQAAKQLFDDAIAKTHEANVEHQRRFALPNSSILFLEHPISEIQSVESSIVNAGTFSFIDVEHKYNGKPQQKSHYQIAGETGRVIRYDMDVVERPPEVDVDKIESSDPETARQAVEDIAHSQSNATENLRLGEQMGVNGQEVGPGELKKLARILNSSRPYYNN